MPERTLGVDERARVMRDMGHPVPRELSELEQGYADAETARVAAICDAHGLTATEVAAAESIGMAPGRYAALKGVTNVDQYAALRKSEQAQAEVEAEARRQIAVDAERARIEQEAKA